MTRAAAVLLLLCPVATAAFQLPGRASSRSRCHPLGAAVDGDCSVGGKTSLELEGSATDVDPSTSRRAFVANALTASSLPFFAGNAPALADDVAAGAAVYAYRSGGLPSLRPLGLTKLLTRYEGYVEAPKGYLRGQLPIAFDFPSDWLQLDKLGGGIQYVDQRNGDKLYVLRATLPEGTDLKSVGKQWFADAVLSPGGDVVRSGVVAEGGRASRSQMIVDCSADDAPNPCMARRRLILKYDTVTGSGVQTVERRGLVEAYQVENEAFMLLTTSNAVKFEQKGSKERETVDNIVASFKIGQRSLPTSHTHHTSRGARPHLDDAHYRSNMTTIDEPTSIGNARGLDEESCWTSESTPLHDNIARSRSESLASDSLTFGIVATSPTSDGRSGYVSSTVSYNSTDDVTPGNRSSATTPMTSNVSSADDDGGKPLPVIPSMTAGNSGPRLPPRYRRTSKGGSSDGTNERSDEDQRKRPRHVHSLGSRIKMSSTLVILVLGLILAVATLVEYAVRPPRNGSDSGIANENQQGGETVANDGNDSIEELRSRMAKADELFDELGRYIIKDYDALPTFSSFLPGVAGIYGKPVWSFYVNRGQAIASFGVKSKDYPIMEYFSANNAYQNTPLLGFRTFYQIHRGGGWGKGDESFLVEPFDTGRTRFLQSSDGDAANLPSRTMYIGSNEMQIREVDHVHKIETNVTYFVLPEEDFGAFIRRTTIANLDKDRKLHLSVLDGLARIQSAGGKLNSMLKTIGRTLEGWMGVYDADHSSMPFFRMSTEPADSEAVVIEEEGHFCLSYLESHEKEFLPIVYDTSKVFGRDSSLMRPIGLLTNTVKSIVAGKQYGAAKTSSAFSATEDVVIYPGESITINTFYGKTSTIADVPVIARRINQLGFAQYKLTRARELVKQITSDVETTTGNKLFDGYVKQMYLDNSLRGGVPVLLGEIDDQSHSLNADEDARIKVYHLFSRIHGDLERDYNDFVIEPTFFSEGPGNFRDVAQNRRNDVIINPRLGSFNVKLFLSFIQADGYNPLSVEAVVFTIDDRGECDRLAAKAVGFADGHRADREKLAAILCDGAFRPGQLADMIEKQNIFLMTNLPELIDNVAASASYHGMAVSKDGYWADHWTYHMDLIESYLQIYPDREEELLWEEELPYYFSSRVVQPRAKKYALSKSFNGKWNHVRQLNPTIQDSSRAKTMRRYMNNLTGWYTVDAHYHHDTKGRVVKSTPIAKLFLLATMKFATRDAYGMGIEYEGGKPGWNDAMNGLVGMLGSGMPETYELKALLQYIRAAVAKYKRPVAVPEELGVLIGEIMTALDELGDEAYLPTSDTVPSALFRYWDAVASAREDYVRNIASLSCETMNYSPTEMLQLLDRWIGQVDLGIARAHSVGSHGHDNQDELLGITPTYFSYNVTQWKKTGDVNRDGLPLVNATEMAVAKFPLFLEGVVRMMKTVDGAKASSIYKAVMKSGLRDEQLKMYTLSSSLEGQSFDMGRMMGFSPGWLENQSVWLHMSYKYYLELLRKGMHNEFFTEMQSGMLPFMDGAKYGRSLLECSSFIASSAFEDPRMHGQGFLARLSGSTAEFLSMWVLMMIGPSPFRVNEETRELEMQLSPALPKWLFANNPTAVAGEQYSVHFKLFTSINTRYFTPVRRDLFGDVPARYEIGLRDGSKIRVDGPTIPNDLAQNIRKVVFIDFIHAFF
ncbi:hypothetical protein ACHAXT_010739 [Thalassiosira profunda]